MITRSAALRILLSLGALGSSSSGVALAQHPATGPLQFDALRARRVDSIFMAYDSAGSPGCAVGIFDAGHIRYARGFGLADIANRTRITLGSVFGLASVAKQFTALSVLLLAQDGALSLDDDVRKWVPQLPDYGVPMGAISIRELLHHTSGIPNYVAMLNQGWAITDTLTQGDVLEFLKARPLDFAPGTRYRYSNSGYALLEMIVQRASGRSLRAFAQARIFGPLKMGSTAYRDDHTRILPRLANAYISKTTTVPGDQRLLENGPQWQEANPKTDVAGDAGLYSTVEDLARWDANFYSGAVGGPAMRRLMEEPAVLVSGDTIPYAAGLMLGAYGGLRTIGHVGGWSGHQSRLIRYPDQHLTIAILCNRRGFTPADDPSQRIARIYLGDRMAPDVVSLLDSAIARGGADSAVRLYHSLRAGYPVIAFDEQQINALGYRLMRAGTIEAAIRIFGLNVETFPKSANTYDSLGEAYMTHGDTALAITNYERSLALDPGNDNARQMLAKLRRP